MTEPQTERYFQIQNSDSFYACAESLRTNQDYNIPQEWHSFRFPDYIRIEFEPFETELLETGWNVWIMSGANCSMHSFVLAPGLLPNQETAIALHQEYIVEPVRAKLAEQAKRRAAIDAEKAFHKGAIVEGTYTANPNLICAFTGEITYIQVRETGLCYDITLLTTEGTFHAPGDVLRYVPGDDSFQVKAV